MNERIEIKHDARGVNDQELVEHLKKGGSVVFEPGVESIAAQQPANQSRDVLMVPGYREPSSGTIRGFVRGFDATVMKPRSK